MSLKRGKIGPKVTGLRVAGILGVGVRFQLVQTRTDLYLHKGRSDLAPFRGNGDAPTLVRGGETGYLIQNKEIAELQRERKTDERFSQTLQKRQGR